MNPQHQFRMLRLHNAMIELHAARDAAGGFDADVAEAAMKIGYEGYSLALDLHGAPQVEPAAIAPQPGQAEPEITVPDMVEAIARRFAYERRRFEHRHGLVTTDRRPYSELDAHHARVAVQALGFLFGTDRSLDDELPLTDDDDV